MAPTIKWQRWDSASYNWFGTASTDALPSLEAELDAWITTVNGNASNVGRSITKERGYADSTAVDSAGLVISAGANGNAAKGYLHFGLVGSTSSKRVYAGNAYADDTSRDGYGTVTGGPSDTGISWLTSGDEASWMIVSDTTDGQEYFSFGPTFGNNTTNYMEGFFIFKGTDGEWSMTSNDGINQYHVHYWDDVIGTGWGPCTRTTAADNSFPAATNNYRRYVMYNESGSLLENLASPADGFQSVYAANPEVLETSQSTTYRSTGKRRVLSSLGDGNNVYVLTGYAYGPSFLVDLRP